MQRTPPPGTTDETGSTRSGEVDIQELQRILAHQQQVIQNLQSQNQRSQNSGMTVLTEGTIGNYFHYSIRDALEAIPSFDGNNISFVYFVEGCEEALSMIVPTQELNLVRAARNKLKGDAHRSILGKTFASMQEFVEFLRTKYGPRETVYEAQGRLAYLYQKKDEKVVAYANRIRELGKRILDAQKRETGEISIEFQNSIEKHLKTSFLRGLNKEIIIPKEGTFAEVESRAIDAEKELETINMIKKIVLAEDAPVEKRATTRRIEAIAVTCQYCQKKGHTADKCWQIQRNQNRPGFSRENVNNNNNPKQPSFSDSQPNSNQSGIIICRYCKKSGHKLEECRKRIYNNNLQQNSNQGNEQIPARTGATPGKINVRPTRVVSEEPESDIEE